MITRLPRRGFSPVQRCAECQLAGAVVMVCAWTGQPAVLQELTRADRQALERFCDRLPEIIPAMPPVLTHGDLWPGNLLNAEDSRIAVIGPSLSCTWDEATCPCSGAVSARRKRSASSMPTRKSNQPVAPGWAKRLPLHVREQLSSIRRQR